MNDDDWKTQTFLAEVGYAFDEDTGELLLTNWCGENCTPLVIARIEADRLVRSAVRQLVERAKENGRQ